MPRLDRLDRAVGLVLALIACAIGVLLARGDQVGARLLSSKPDPGERAVALRPTLLLQFSEPMRRADVEARLAITPAISGTWSWAGATASFAPGAPLLPAATYTVTLAPGAVSVRGRVMTERTVIPFTTRQARLAYLWPASGVANLVLAELDAAGALRPRALTSEPFGVYDFAVSPDGAWIVYAATRDISGSRDLWLIDTSGGNRRRIVACEEQLCGTASWSADGQRIAFERRKLEKGTFGVTPGPSRAWIFDLPTNTASALYTDTQVLAALPRWSPTGERLTFYDNLLGVQSLVDLRAGSALELPSMLGDPPVWAPDGNAFVFADLVSVGEERFQQLLRFDLASGVITPAQTLTRTDDGSPTWSPLGDRIAFGRRVSSDVAMQDAVGFFGPQVWVADLPAGTARALTADYDHSHGALTWSPDGRWIAFMRTSLREINPAPEIWLIAPDGTSAHLAVRDALLPAWVP